MAWSNRVKSRSEEAPWQREVSNTNFNETDDWEFFPSKYEKNIQPPAVHLLTRIPTITPAQVSSWFHIARVVQPYEDVYEDIVKYVANGQEHKYGLKVLDIIRIVRDKEADFPRDNKLRMLLWHGTKPNFLPVIFQNGFKPPPATGQMFGTGIYFADRCSKSVNYCGAVSPTEPSPGTVVHMLLCDVLIGDVYNAKNAKNDVGTAPQIVDKSGRRRPCDSVKCTGRFVPDRQEQKMLEKNVVIPNGPTMKNTQFPDYSVNFSEFIVYSGENAKVRYLVKLEVTPGKVQFSMD